MTTEETDICSPRELSRQNSGATGSWESDLSPVQHALKFVKSLEDQYICPVCKGVVFNPHQSGCGHIFCHRCIQGLLEEMNPVCPLDGGLIKSNEVFQDNCCKREISNLEVYCTNAPNCSCRITLCRLQEHLQVCQYEVLQCSNAGCSEVMQRRNVLEHLRISCTHRMDSCQHCKKPYKFCQLKEHEMTMCPEVEIDCPNKCYQKIKRCKVTDHTDECPEVETECVYAKFGCSVRDKRSEIRVHENTALNHHVLLILRSNTNLEKQMEAVQQEVLFRNQVLQDNSQMVSSLEREVRPLTQHVSRCDQTLSAVERSLSEQKDHMSNVRAQLQELARMFSPGLASEGLSYLRTSLDSLKQQVSTTESLKDHLVALEENYKRHSRLLDIHTAQLERNEERFKELEATSYDGKLIWKIRDFRKKKEAGVQGLQPCFCSVPFHTGRCGYKMAVKAYLNGDGDGKGSHLSLYVVLMRSDFDALLPWPFRQTVSLSVLDQSGANNHYTLNLRPDPACSSFQRPGSDVAANVASGFPRFISHAQLEAAKMAVYVREDSLFVKVKVDTTGLDDL